MGDGDESSKTVIVIELDVVAKALLDINARFVLVKTLPGPSIKVKSKPTGSTDDVMRTVIVPVAEGSVTLTVTAAVGIPAP